MCDFLCQSVSQGFASDCKGNVAPKLLVASIRASLHMPSADTWLDTLQAVLGGHPVVLGQLFDAGVSLSRPDANNVTLLSRAVLQEHPKLVELLLKLNHPVDLRYAGCKTAMHHAAAFLVEAYLAVQASNKDEEDDEAVLAVNSVNDSRLKAAKVSHCLTAPS